MTQTTKNCYAWAIERTDGHVFGFTDHDQEVSFEGAVFKPTSGLSSSAISKTTGLSVDTTEVLGGITDASVREEDIVSGKFDNASVRCWRFNWSDLSDRSLEFRGLIGEIRQTGGTFQAEIRGLAALLNRPRGRLYQSPCSAVLGDKRCKLATNNPAFSRTLKVIKSAGNATFILDDPLDLDEGWFVQGAFFVLSGDHSGSSGMIKLDEKTENHRKITLWKGFVHDLQPGEDVRITAGCDKQFLTCQKKFSNTVNFRGFPDIPNDQYVMQSPEQFQNRDGGSLRSW